MAGWRPSTCSAADKLGDEAVVPAAVLRLAMHTGADVGLGNGSSRAAAGSCDIVPIRRTAAL